MSLSALLLFAGVYFAAVATPGPGIAALVARVIGHGLKGVAPFILGFVAGDMVWLCVAATGLAVIAHEFAGVFLAIKFAGAAYLLYIAWGLARSSSGIAPGAAPPSLATGFRAFLGGFTLTTSNPKVIVFFLSILPLAVDLDKLTPLSFLEIAGVSVVVLSATLTSYALAANRARGLMLSTRAMGLVRRAMAGVMAGVAVAIVTR